jgi:hypothetical protein
MPDNPEPEDYIGTATMKEDGTIVLYLRATAEGGVVGHGMLEYPRTHPKYRYVLEHLEGLQPGEEKAVRPFPDEEE